VCVCVGRQVLRPSAVNPSLATIPAYLIPELSAAPDLTIAFDEDDGVGGKRRFDDDDDIAASLGSQKRRKGGRGGDNDPLRSFNYSNGAVYQRPEKKYSRGRGPQAR
jgi:hypothetical protein